MQVKVVMKNKVDDLLKLKRLFEEGFLNEEEKNLLKKEILKSKHIYWNRLKQDKTQISNNLQWISEILKNVKIKLNSDDIHELINNLENADFCEKFKTLRKEKEYLPILVNEKKVIDSKGVPDWKALSTGDLPIPRYYKKYRFVFNQHKFLVYSCWYKNADQNSNNRIFFEEYITKYIASKNSIN